MTNDYGEINGDTLSTDSGSLTVSSDSGTWWEYTIPAYTTASIPSKIKYTYDTCGPPIKKEGGEENMRYLYEVILVNPKNDTFYVNKVIAKSETSALMTAYNQYKDGFVGEATCIPFDDLKTSCRVLMEWKKEKSLKKAIETIKKAVE